MYSMIGQRYKIVPCPYDESSLELYRLDDLARNAPTQKEREEARIAAAYRRILERQLQRI